MFYNKHNIFTQDKQNFTHKYENLSKYFIAAHETYILLVIGAHYGTILNTPQTAVIVVITGTRNHQTTYNLNHLEIKYVPRVLQVGGTANANLFFSLLNTKLTRIDGVTMTTTCPWRFFPLPAISLQGAENTDIIICIPITRYALRQQ